MKAIPFAPAAFLLAAALSHAAPPPAIAPGSLRLCAKDWSPPIVVATPTKDKITIDGALIESAWTTPAKEDVAAAFRARDGRRLPLLETECRVLVDGATLYFGARCKTPAAPSSPAAAPDKEAGVYEGGRLALCLDTEYDGLTFLMFTINPHGQTAAARVQVRPDGSRSETNVQAIAWKAAAVQSAEGWTVEAAIPLDAVLTPPVRNHGFAGFNAVRYPDGPGQAAFWSAKHGALAPDGFGLLGLAPAPARAWLGSPQAGDSAPLYIANTTTEERAVRLAVSTRGQKESSDATEAVTIPPRQCKMCPIPLSATTPGVVEASLTSDDQPRPFFRCEILTAPGPMRAWLAEPVCYEGRGSVDLHVSAPAAKADKVRVTVSAADAAAPLLESTQPAPAGQPFTASLDAASLRPGRYTVTVALLDSAGAQTGAATCSLTLQARAVHREPRKPWRVRSVPLDPEPSIPSKNR